MNTQPTPLSRRRFVGAAGLVAGSMITRPLFGQNAPSNKLNVALIGVWGRGLAHYNALAEENVVALCDINEAHFPDALKRFPGATTYIDWRKCLDHKGLDAVMICTPDHHHYLPTALAMEGGKHVYTQKPLVHTVWEARQLLAATKKFKVATQMGNQGHSGPGNREIYEYVNSGMLGDITEIHCCTNRPVWPQGIARPDGTDPIPEHLDWDLFLGCAPERPFKDKRVYTDFNWRGWYDFGGGALADMACHTMDSIFWSMNLSLPTSVEVLEIHGHTEETFPKGGIFRWTYAAGKLPNGKPRPELVIYWYEGKLLKDGVEVPASERMRRPAKLAEGKNLAPSGNVYFGTKHDLIVEGNYGDTSRIAQTEEEKKTNPIAKPPEMLERLANGATDFGQYMDWRRAITGEIAWDAPGSNFLYSAPFTESILLGNIALRVGKMNEKLIYDGAKMSFTNNDVANSFLTKEYRKGWSHTLV